MASITIRNLDEGLKARLRVRAAKLGRSMEDEAREILRSALARQTRTPKDLTAAIRRRFAPFGGVDLADMPRDALREPPGFDS